MKEFKHKFAVLGIGTMLLGMLGACSLEKRVVVTTRGYEATYPNGHQSPGYELLHDYDSSPRDTVLNYRIGAKLH